MTLRAGIIGAGAIAWRYDAGAWTGQGPSVTLASCLNRHPDTQLVAVHDTVAEARDDFNAGYLGASPVDTYEKLEDFMDCRLDLVAIASPSEWHATHIEACLKASVPRLWIEKPVTLNLDDYQSLLVHYRSLHKPPRICVNYQRRCLPQLQYMKEHLATSPDSKALTSIAITYSRRLDVNGVHLLDLLGALTEAQDVPPLDFLRAGDGINPQFGLTLMDHPVTVTGHDLPYHLIELSITDSRGRLSLVRGAQDLVWQSCVPNPDYPGFFHLAEPTNVAGMAENLAASQEAAYRMLCSLINDSEPSSSTLETAWFSQALLDRVQHACKVQP